MRDAAPAASAVRNRRASSAPPPLTAALVRGPADAAPRTAGPIRRAGDGLALALTFLTVAPVPVRAGADPRRAPAWFPLVGALVGAMAGAVRYGLDTPLGATPASVLAAMTLVVATGALHLDGLADCADGLGVRARRIAVGEHPDDGTRRHAPLDRPDHRARRLAVMREPQVGVFAVVAVGLWLFLVVSTLARLEAAEALAALVAACALGRWSALLHAAQAPPARRDGLGAAFDVTPRTLVAASATAVAIALAVQSPLPAACATLAAVLTALAVTAWAVHWLGGRTGDTLGACVALAEAAVCVAVAALA